MTINIERAQAIQGWMSDEELTYLAETASRHKMICEIGSWKGRSSVAIATNTTGNVHCVDTWKGSAEAFHAKALNMKDENWLFDEFKNNTKGLNNIRPIQLPSLIAAEYFKAFGVKFDMIFIDASHDFDSVSNDIRVWKELLTDDGILCGHDYTKYWTGVIEAVQLNVKHFRTIDSIWTTEVENGIQ